MAQKGCIVVCGDAGEALGDSLYEARLYVRGSVAGLGADCIEKEMHDLASRAGARAAARRRQSTMSIRPSSAATARRGSSTTSRSTTSGATELSPRAGGAERLASGAARVGDVRPRHDRRDPARRARGDVRHPRLRGQAAGAALRRPAVPRRQRFALSARGLPRALRHRRRDRDAVRARADPARDPDHDRRDELRRAVGPGQGGARTRRERGRHLDDDGRRRDDPGGARALEDARLPAAAVALRDEPRRPAPRRRDRGRRRPGRQARRRRNAARPQDLRPRRRDARPAEGDRPAQRLPAPRLDRPRRPRDQDRGAARDHRLADPDLRQGRRVAHLLRRGARGQGRRGRDRARRHAGRHRRHSGGVHRARRDPDPGRDSAGRRVARRSSGCTARCS